jgi:cobalt-zinc-cadmium efflux system protein
MAHEHLHARREADERALRRGLAVLAAFMVVEVLVGVFAHSLAVLSDAGHMLTDAAALGLSLLATRLAARPAHGAMTYGLGRVEILSAQINGLTLVGLAIAIVVGAISHLVHPAATAGLPVLIVALAGVAVNLLVTRLLGGDHHGHAHDHGLALEGSLRHILTDLYGFALTALAAIIILATGFHRADAIASLLIAGLMLQAGVALLRASIRVFLEAAPVDLDPERIGRFLAGRPGVVQVHDLHVWEVTSGFPALSAHVVVGAGRDCHELRRELQQSLVERFGIDHTTLQVDHEAAAQPPLQIEILDRREGRT